MDYKFIADTHLYDDYSLEWRDYLHMSLDDYAEMLVDNWNYFTHDEDIVLLDGDIGHYCERTLRTLRRLKGTLILVVGNHDSDWGTEIYHCGIFKGIHVQVTLNSDVHVQHKPEFSDAMIQRYKYLIHGHHHRYDMPNMQMKLSQYANNGKQLNCAADLNNHRPCTLQELILNKEINLDRYRDIGLL